MPPTSLSPLLVSTLALPLLALGCAVEPPTSTTTVYISPGCIGIDCGKNGKIVEGSAVGHLKRDKVTANNWEITLHDFIVPHRENIRLGVDRDRMVGVSTINGMIIAQPWDLTDAIIIVKNDDDEYFNIRVKAVNSTWAYWTPPHTTIYSYTLKYDGPYAAPTPYPTSPYDEVPLCPQIDEPWLGEHTMDAAVFEGEIYHQDTLTIEDTVTGVNAWFNIACAHSASLKQMFTRRIRRARPPGSGTTDDEPRMAMLSAWVGRYCGDETAFTVTGVPLLVRDDLAQIPQSHDASWSDSEANTLTYEAVWNHNGAVCLNTPRRFQYSDAKPQIHDDGALDAIRKRCNLLNHGLPSCQSLVGPTFPIGWEAHGDVLTAFPTANLTPPPKPILSP
jgi:hypothetical protein